MERASALAVHSARKVSSAEGDTVIGAKGSSKSVPAAGQEPAIAVAATGGGCLTGGDKGVKARSCL